jgi:peptidoglycan/LPS O-acetylase OafA/YrhL
MTAASATALSVPVATTSRVAALDGLRGIAAAIVVVYHFLCMFLPAFAAEMSATPHPVVHYPIAILWNGPFAVSIFFVLSGFVMAAATARRADLLVANCVSRYCRLALPILASVVLAWCFLTLLPDATRTLEAQLASPSRWLEYSFQGDIPGLPYAVADALVLNFVNGLSRFNNVLWTMQIELIGSLLIFFIYFFARSSLPRLLISVGAVSLAIFALRDFYYLSFMLGLLIYEFCYRRRISPLAPWLPLAALVVGVVLGGLSEGAHERWGLPPAPFGVQSFELGRSDGLVPVLAATAILYAVVNLAALSTLFATALPRFLGRISFPLYLVHVPLLYTWVAFAYTRTELSLAALFGGYVAMTLLLAFLGTLFVEEPTLALARRVRERVAALGRGAPAEGVAR